MIEALLAGAAIFAAGLLAGRFVPGRRKGPKPVEPYCGCDHHYSMHEPKTGECHGRVKGEKAEIVRDAEGNPVRDSWGEVQKIYGRVQCGCRRYSGPEPLPEFFAPQLSPGES